MITVKIYSGPHYTESVAKEYEALGSFDQVEEGARSWCGRMIETRGKRVWVDFLDKDGVTLTHRIFQEG